MTGPTNSEFLLTVTVGTLKTPAFRRTLMWVGMSTTYLNQVSDAGRWIRSVVSPLSLLHIRILCGAKGLISINSYIGAWLWRELKAANSYKGAAPLALA